MSRLSLKNVFSITSVIGTTMVESMIQASDVKPVTAKSSLLFPRSRQMGDWNHCANFYLDDVVGRWSKQSIDSQESELQKAFKNLSEFERLRNARELQIKLFGYLEKLTSFVGIARLEIKKVYHEKINDEEEVKKFLNSHFNQYKDVDVPFLKGKALAILNLLGYSKNINTDKLKSLDSDLKEFHAKHGSLLQQKIEQLTKKLLEPTLSEFENVISDPNFENDEFPISSTSSEIALEYDKTYRKRNLNEGQIFKLDHYSSLKKSDLLPMIGSGYGIYQQAADSTIDPESNIFLKKLALGIEKFNVIDDSESDEYDIVALWVSLGMNLLNVNVEAEVGSRIGKQEVFGIKFNAIECLVKAIEIYNSLSYDNSNRPSNKILDKIQFFRKYLYTRRLIRGAWHTLYKISYHRNKNQITSIIIFGNEKISKLPQFFLQGIRKVER